MNSTHESQNAPDAPGIAFPSLTEEQLAEIQAIGEVVEFSSGDSLITHGERGYSFFAIRQGEVRIVEECEAGDTLIATLGPGTFTGDVDMLTGRSAVTSTIAVGSVEAYRLDPASLRRLLAISHKVGEILLDTFQARRELLDTSEFVGVQLVGEKDRQKTTRMREFLYKNHVPHTFTEAKSDDGQELLSCLDASNLALPIVRCNRRTFGDPTLFEIAECIGITRDVGDELFDLVVIGAGPAGLSASVYAASEGVKTLVIDSVGPGGQAASSSRIENFVGFPSGLSGSELANRGYLQALKFGAQFIAPVSVQSVHTTQSQEHQLRLSTGGVVRARSLLVVSGMTYRQLDIPDYRRFLGAGVYYAATAVEARQCEKSTCVVVGGGNSAGQAAMFLVKSVKAVKLVVRGGDVRKSMSEYLSTRILHHPDIEVLTDSVVTAVEGDTAVDRIEVTNTQTRETQHVTCGALFVFIGARPHTDWLPASVALDDGGFVLTGASVAAHPLWQLERAPHELETTTPGIMAGGDVRSGTTKRCGFAVGDGSLAVTCVNRYLRGS
ncbi:MAG: FAD-dependent oxidoreductase [Planctomycetota bacterium]